MQKIERQTTSHGKRKSFIPLLSFVLMPLFALSPFFDTFLFGERSLSFFVVIDIVTVLTLIVAYRIARRRTELTFTSIQLSAFAFFAVATVIFFQHAPSFDTFFGITDATRAYLPIAFFTLTILFAPLLTHTTTTSIRLFLSVLFALPLLVLPSAIFDGITVSSAYVGVIAFVAGAFALPLYTMTFRNFLIAGVVFGATLTLVWLSIGNISHSIMLILVAISMTYFVRMLTSAYYARRTHYVATRLMHNPTLRVQGVFALVSVIVIFCGYGAYGLDGVVGSLVQEQNRIQEMLVTLRDTSHVGYTVIVDGQYSVGPTTILTARGTLVSYVQSTGLLGLLAFLALVLSTIYATVRALREPDYYEKNWYTLVQVHAGIAGIGTLGALLMPVGSGGMLLVASAFALLCVSIAKISPSDVVVFMSSKHIVTRRLFALALMLLVLLTWYYGVIYATATVAAARSSWREAYQYMPSSHYLAGALLSEAERFRNDLASNQNMTTTLEEARTVTTHIVEAREQYPDDIKIMHIALLHYELLTQLGVDGAVQEAVTLLELLHARNPESTSLIMRYATALLEAERPQEARDLLDKKESLLTSDAASERDHLYAYVLMALEEYDAATEMFSRALARGVSDSSTYLAYALSQVHSSIPAAREILAKAIVKFPDEASVYVYAALIEQIAGDRNAARAILEKGVRRAALGDTALLQKLLDELVTYGSITSIGVANMPTPALVDMSTASTTATSTPQ